jgi:probable F420-dependent oxidoreductase
MDEDSCNSKHLEAEFMGDLQIGLGISTSAKLDADPVAEARLAEAVKFDFVSASDHLHGTSPTFEPWTLLTTVAAATTRLKVLTRVLAVPYRHPAVTAKMAETLDRLSGGRLLLGLGSGYLDEEFRAFGIPDASPGERIGALEEAIRITRGLWSDAPFSFEGRTYRIADAQLEPKPLHRIPIWLGMYKPRGLALTGRLADGWIPSYGFAPPDVVVGLADRVRRAAEAEKRDPAEITFAYNIPVRIGPSAEGTASGVTGSAAEVADRLVELAALGFDALNLIPTGPGTPEQIEALGGDVLPTLRTAAAS